jgi:DNA-binding transcriptional regulator YhcF (GntR family)
VNKGWIRLHRSSLDNEVFRKDKTAWDVYTIALMLTDWEIGKALCSISEITSYTAVARSTVWRALKRLEGKKMVVLEKQMAKQHTKRFTQQDTQQFTQQYAEREIMLITICNWHEYQGKRETVDETVDATLHATDRARKTERLLYNKKLKNAYAHGAAQGPTGSPELPKGWMLVGESMAGNLYLRQSDNTHSSDPWAVEKEAAV